MGWMKKLMGKDETHDEWLAAHPGKESKKSEAPPIDLEQEARTRATMEGEMSAARQKRDS